MRCAAAFAVLLLAFPLLPAHAQSGGIQLELVGDATRHVPFANPHASFLFRVTNLGAQADYVTVAHGGIRWRNTTNRDVNVIPSPEYGLYLAPGATGEMRLLGVEAPMLSGADTMSMPFVSEVTGQRVSIPLTLIVDPESASGSSLSVLVVDASGAPVANAQVELMRLNATTPAMGLHGAGAGRFNAQLPPARYSVYADAPGLGAASALVDLAPTAVKDITLVLRPSTWRVTSATLTNVSLDDSSWNIAASDDLARVISAPMGHNPPPPGAQPRPGYLYGANATGALWGFAFDAIKSPHQDAGPFQANDMTVTVSRDGTRVAALDWNGVLHVLDATTGKELWGTDRAGDTDPAYPATVRFARGFFSVGATQFSPDGTALAVGGSNGWLVVFNAANGTVRWTHAWSSEIRALTYAPDGSKLYVGQGLGVDALDAANGTSLWNTPTQFWPFFSMGIDKNGTRLSEGGKDSTLRILDAANGKVLLSYAEEPDFITGISMLEDGSRYVLSTWPRGVRALDPAGNLLWARAYGTASQETTPDGAFTLVAWQAQPGASGLDLLDAEGARLWSSPDLAPNCPLRISPFPSGHMNDVVLRMVAPGVLRGASSCVGGALFEVEFHVAAQERPPIVTPPSPSPPSAPTQGGSPTHATTPPPQGTTSTLPPAASTAAARTPLPSLPWLVLGVAFVALILRRSTARK